MSLRGAKRGRRRDRARAPTAVRRAGRRPRTASNRASRAARAGVLVEVRRGADEQRAAVRAAEHAGEHARARGRSPRRSRRPRARAGPGRARRRRSTARPRRPDRSRPARRRAAGAPRPAIAVAAAAAPNDAHTRRSVSDPSAAMSNAVTRLPNVSSTSSTPSSVITLPFGNHRSSATRVTLPSGSTRSRCAAVERRAGHQVEAEVADVGAALRVDDHVVRVPGRRVAPRSACVTSVPSGSRRSSGGRASTRSAAGRPAASRARTAAAAPRPRRAGPRRPRARTAPRAGVEVGDPDPVRRASAGTRGSSSRPARPTVLEPWSSPRGAGDAQPRGRQCLQTLRCDRLTASSAAPVPALGHPIERGVHVREVRLRQRTNGRELLAFERDRRPLRVVLVVEIAACRRRSDRVEIRASSPQCAPRWPPDRRPATAGPHRRPHLASSTRP